MSTVINIENLSKKYVIGHQKKESYVTLRDEIVHKIRGVGERLRHPLSINRENVDIEEFWALKNINLEIKHGDRVGIIGKNGAGKSTLLKILSRITAPTKGRVTIKGRVVSLLEVGTGFHPELTGRENIYLNGAILGMSKTEIGAKFDEIVAFSEVGKFLDTPVKRYSSGMYVRLAFAVAAHLEAEVLIVDEVLAVGDAVFQKKCIRKMDEIASDGNTVLFVSHNMDVVRKLCDSAVLLKGGVVDCVSNAESVINSYLSVDEHVSAVRDRGKDSSKQMHLRSMRVLDYEGNASCFFNQGELATVEILYDVNRPVIGAHVFVRVQTLDGVTVFSTGDCDVNLLIMQNRQVGSYIAKFDLPTHLMNEGEYYLTFSLSVPFGNVYDMLSNALRISIVCPTQKDELNYIQKRPGVVVQNIVWNTIKL